jgi:hypothetical protein
VVFETDSGQFYSLVAADPENLRTCPNPSTFPWVLEICVDMVVIHGSSALFVVLCHKRKILLTNLSKQME